MSAITFIIGNRNYSSWSLRGWLMVRRAGVEFTEVMIPLDEAGFKEEILSHSAAGLVPILKTGGQTLWDSLAIGEYLAETNPDAGLWPAEASKRAEARCVASEMHSGFAALRTHMPMDLRNSLPGQGMAPGVAEDIARITRIWTDCRRDHGEGGPFLFGSFTIADAMFAPVVGRFRTYGVELDDSCQNYADAVWQWPDMREWVAAAAREPQVINLAT